ncbi:tetratricopeptide repeat protein, partial [Pseudomonas sp. RA_105y_Pfl1_P41]|uniref:tetratricopeptide repeat protein n=1 Tax=Pseudomonas sp. RA_105y_Pfl1_P41 TaxID=3088700 RepID=UPI0030DDD289
GRPQDALPAYAQLERLRPDDAQVWSQHAVTLAMVKGEGLAGEPEALLARAYEQLGRPQDALPAYAQLERLRPDDAQVWSQHAVTLAMVKGEGLAGE